MNRLREIVLIGDPVDERFNWFKELLDDQYGKEAVQARTLDEVREFAINSANLTIPLVFLSDDLPVSTAVLSKGADFNFSTLQFNSAFPFSDFVCIVTKKENPVFDEKIKKRPYHVHFPVLFPTDEDRKRIVIELGALGNKLLFLIESSAIAKITEWDNDNRIVKRQIRAMSEVHDLADGANHLFRLIRNCLNCNNVEKIRVEQLGQGKSGASVFRLILSGSDIPEREYVLKLSDELWKLESEVRGHLEASGAHFDSYTKHVAALRRPISSIQPVEPTNEDDYIVNSGQWYAIHYDFLGSSKIGGFVDLETVLTSTSKVLIEKTKAAAPALILASTDVEALMDYRLTILTATLDGLCDLWYANEELMDRRVEAIWKTEDAPDREFIPLPPYQLTRRAKGWIQDFLDGREAVTGYRLFPNWDSNRDLVLNLVGEDDISGFKVLNREIPFTLSPVHGDLNGNNVLLWLKYDNYPFVIDLPFYQKDGHALQDFARLETEIKFALMDRQEESPIDKLIAFDNNVSQVPLWIEMEGCLIKNVALKRTALTDAFHEECAWTTDGFKGNVSLCYKMVLLIRMKAFEVQQKMLADRISPGPFADEYLPALLYHTVRSIGYPSLSVFKRLLAVHSAGLILNRMQEN